MKIPKKNSPKWISDKVYPTKGTLNLFVKVIENGKGYEYYNNYKKYYIQMLLSGQQHV